MHKGGERERERERVLPNQCDQIWQNFANLANF